LCASTLCGGAVGSPHRIPFCAARRFPPPSSRRLRARFDEFPLGVDAVDIRPTAVRAVRDLALSLWLVDRSTAAEDRQCLPSLQPHGRLREPPHLRGGG